MLFFYSKVMNVLMPTYLPQLFYSFSRPKRYFWTNPVIDRLSDDWSIFSYQIKRIMPTNPWDLPMKSTFLNKNY